MDSTTVHTPKAISHGLPRTRNQKMQHHLLWHALLQLLPKDSVGALATLGILVGIGYYVITKDSWLLGTFLGILTGTTIEKSRCNTESRNKL